MCRAVSTHVPGEVAHHPSSAEAGGEIAVEPLRALHQFGVPSLAERVGPRFRGNSRFLTDRDTRIGVDEYLEDGDLGEILTYGKGLDSSIE